MHSWKLLLTALGTGAFLGTLGGTAWTPEMKPAPEQPWRQGFGPQEAPAPLYEIAEAPPQDLAPQGWTYGAARAFPEERMSGARRAIAFRYDDGVGQTQPDEQWSYAATAEDEAVRPAEAAPVADEVPALEAAEAARDAALDAQDQGVEPVALAIAPNT